MWIYDITDFIYLTKSFHMNINLSHFLAFMQILVICCVLSWRKIPFSSLLASVLQLGACKWGLGWQLLLMVWFVSFSTPWIFAYDSKLISLGLLWLKRSSKVECEWPLTTFSQGWDGMEESLIHPEGSRNFCQ